MKPFRTTYAAAALALAAFAPASHAAGVEVLNEGFNNLAGLSNWTRVNHSIPAGTGWFQGNPDIFAAQAGAANAYAGANFLGAANGTGLVDNWLITPVLALSGLTTLSFYTNRDGTPGFADRLEVRFSSSSGSGTDGFDTVLRVIGGDTSFPSQWQQWSANLTADGAGRFAFRYLGDASTLNYVGLDSVKVITAVPEPSSYLMLAVGLGALTLMRRKLLK